jgi:hypothetical protein
MEKKLKARMEMLKRLSKDKHSELHTGLGDKLKTKKLSKVEVIAKDEKGLEEGLSKAQQILKAKLGDKVDETEDPAEDEAELCDACEGEGCEYCEEPSEEESDEE